MTAGEDRLDLVRRELVSDDQWAGCGGLPVGGCALIGSLPVLMLRSPIGLSEVWVESGGCPGPGG